LVSYERRGCASCHGADGQPAADASPNAVGLAARAHVLALDALAAHVKKKSAKPAAAEEDGENPDKDVPSLLAYVEAVSKDGVRLSALPEPIRVGGAGIDREDCRQCHQIYGEGGRKGPSLQHLLGKRDKDWLVAHFKEPKKLVPGSKMPPFRFLPDAELSAMSDYLLAMP
ncbi:MAG: c-type cytochrome, partial [Thermoanaerobaculia bacterium]